MGLPNEVNSALIGAAAAGGYEIDQSLRFDGSSYLSRTPSSSGTTTTWTFSCWLKLASTSEGCPISAATSGGYTALFYSVGGEAHFRLSQYVSANQFAKSTTARYRDPGAWYHLVTVYDSTNATASDRIRYYINGVRVTDFSNDGSSITNVDPSSGRTSGINANVAQRIGSQYDGTYAHLKGYMAEAHMLDGTAVTDAEDFGGYDNNGVWRPIEVSGVTYGTNGWYMKFDPGATNGIGHDHSGNGNNFTPTGFSTSGSGTDVMSDTPTTNWCTLNPVFKNINTGNTYSEGALVATNGTGGYSFIYNSTIPVSSGKWYAECTMSAYTGSPSPTIGIQDAGNKKDVGNELVGAETGDVGYDLKAGKIYKDGNYNYATGYTTAGTGDVIGIKLDLDNDNVEFFRNNVSVGSSVPIAAGTDLKVFAGGQGDGAASIGCKFTWNFGQRDFLMTPGTTSGTDYFNTVTYSGNGSTQSITGVGFQPDLVWIKSTSNSYDYYIADSIRGAYAFLISNNTGSQNSTTNYDPMSSFDSDGFSVRYNLTGGFTNDQTNTSGASYIAWCWKAGGASSSNTDGSITSTVSASTAGAFSVCTYTGNTTSGATFGHGLDDAPGFIIVKNRDSGVQPWRIFHSSLGNTKAFKFDNNSADTDSAFWNNTSPSSTVVTLGNDNSTNATGDAYVAYCWAEKAGVTKIGTYTGNETLGDGPEVVCGFRPACVVMKADTSAAWEIHDFKRDANSYLTWNSSGTPTAREANKVLLTDNGFKVQGNDGNINLNGATIYFIAFAAEHTTDDTYKDLNTANLPVPEIKDGSDYFKPLIYLPDGSTSFSVTGVGFQPDLVWIKSRNYAEDHQLNDAVRGATKALQSNSTNGESTQSNGLTSFDSDGFTVGNLSDYNYSGDSIISWNWLAGGSGSSNTDGSTTSTVSASQRAGFSIVSYTGTGSNATVGHGLGVAPKMLIIANRDLNGYNWRVYHESAGNTKYLDLSSDSSEGTTTIWQSTSPSSTVWSMEGNASINRQDDRHICYAFAEVEGYSKFGRYTGTDNADGPFVYTGFRPAWVMVKSHSSGHSYNWVIVDAARDTYNVMSRQLFPNQDYAESTGVSTVVDFLSNGFKWRFGSNGFNGPSVSYIFAAFAENPFGGIGVSPATAR